VAPLYGPLYPGLPTEAGGFFYDPFYYGRYGDYWRRVELPTPAMVRHALPESVISPGGSVDGYLYFEKVNTEVPRVRFRMDPLNSDRGAIGTVEIPLVVSAALRNVGHILLEQTPPAIGLLQKRAPAFYANYFLSRLQSALR
jgi:hypothetical protein